MAKRNKYDNKGDGIDTSKSNINCEKPIYINIDSNT